MLERAIKKLNYMVHTLNVLTVILTIMLSPNVFREPVEIPLTGLVMGVNPDKLSIILWIIHMATHNSSADSIDVISQRKINTNVNK